MCRLGHLKILSNNRVDRVLLWSSYESKSRVLNQQTVSFRDRNTVHMLQRSFIKYYGILIFVQMFVTFVI